MALRFLLVSLVAGMGCELPGSDDLASWSRSGRAWVGARMAELSEIRGGAVAAPAILADAGQAGARPGPEVPTADLAFEVVVEGMASAFVADLAISPEGVPSMLAAPEVVAEATPPLDPAALAWVDPEPAPAAFVEEPPAPRPVASVAGRAQRLGSAIRLTGQALNAWASLIDGQPGPIADAR